MATPARPFFEIPYYHDYISPSLARALLERATPIKGIDGLSEVGVGGGLESPEALRFLVELYEATKSQLGKVLEQRGIDRKFIDERVKACSEFNRTLKRDILDQDHQSVIGLEDATGRVVLGPLGQHYCQSGGQPIAPIPEYLKGPHVTLFGPPDSAKMAINAMNAFHRKIKDEPPIVEELLASSPSIPKWGADDEDSKTPLRLDLVDAAVNLTACFEGKLKFEEAGKSYELANSNLSLPIKRFPGLALPSTFLFYEQNPIPLHLYDFALHLARNWSNPKALVFYVPKLENEEEAKYVHHMVRTAEELIQKRHASYKLGTVRLMVVLENPRAILRTHEIMDALYPYFVGASLGWHDYLASTARLYKNDSYYRIPVKADPEIVIKYIKASHHLLADVVGSRGGIKVGGMYGVLPIGSDPRSESFQLTLKGFFKDVITQMKRNLTGFWVAHPDFVRLGMAIVEAWRLHAEGRKEHLLQLVRSLFNEKYASEVESFISAPDIEGLNPSDPNYVRSLIVTDIKESDFIANNHPDEIRYNVFQSLQYLTDWLSGNGCVALPATVGGVAVRVMDDLATAERSRWEVWHELYHGRFSIEQFLQIVHEEMNFIRRDQSNESKIVQVKWNEKTEKWYPVALRVMLQLMTNPKPVEFATELLLPFTVEHIRSASDPLAELMKLEGEKFKLPDYVERFSYYFEACGSVGFAKAMAQGVTTDFHLAEQIHLGFTKDEIIQVASFHGDIGQSRATLDRVAAGEQALVLKDDAGVRNELQTLGDTYRNKFGIKFLVSAKGKTGPELLSILKDRLNNSQEVEENNARKALWEITKKRLMAKPISTLDVKIEELRKKRGVVGSSIALINEGRIQTLVFGEAKKSEFKLQSHTYFELASLSKTLASAFALDYFARKKIPLNTRVNELLAKTKSKFRVSSSSSPQWGDMVTLEHLMNHTALNQHYVNGIPLADPMPRAIELISGNTKYGYPAVEAISQPGTRFQYSGGGFLVLEHLIEAMEESSILPLTKNFFTSLGTQRLTFLQEDIKGESYACGHLDSGEAVPGGRLKFPSFAAGAMGDAESMALFLFRLSKAYQNIEGAPGITHDTAVQMLHGKDLGCRNFMGSDMGLGVFVAQAEDNKFAIHQGANEGFRCIYLYCFEGPDVDKGFVILTNSDNRAVLFNAEVAQEILKELKFQGIDEQKFRQSFDFMSLPQEQIVNIGYKSLVFDSFKPRLPEAIVRNGPLEALSEYNLLVGAKVTAVTNQMFARAENLFSPYEPVFDPELFGRQGKVMDSWESVRHNETGVDSLRLELRKPSHVRYISLSTKFHDGNHPEFVQLKGFEPSTKSWTEVLPKTKLEGHSLLRIKLPESRGAYSQIQVDMFPDGGLTRVGLYDDLPAAEAQHFEALWSAKSVRFKDPIPKTRKPLSIPYRPQPEEVERNFARAGSEVDFASLAFGASLETVSNEHYGPAQQVISPFPPINMFDGLESARSRKPGNFEEVVVRLGRATPIRRIVLDFTYFVNNNPLELDIQAENQKGEWVTLVNKTRVKAYAANSREFKFEDSAVFTKVRVRTFPDGGINRLKVFGPKPKA